MMHVMSKKTPSSSVTGIPPTSGEIGINIHFLILTEGFLPIVWWL